MPESHDAIIVHLEYIKAGIDELKNGQRLQNGTLAKHDAAIAVLQDRSRSAKAQGRNWGAGAGTLGGFLGGLLAGLFKGGQ